MILTPDPKRRVFAYPAPVDLRKGYDGLFGLVEQGLKLDPMCGDLYLFVNEPRKLCKILVWDGSGLCIFAKRLTLGISMLDRQSQGGVLITVDPRLVRTIADGTSSDRGVLLGRAIAHELGHLLLGRANHARFGLMRGYWSRDELLRARAADWQFTGSEAAQMRRDVLGRLQAAN